MIDIDKITNDLITREGGYVNDQNDKGGETNFGITILQARAYGFTGPMVALPRSLAATIYKDMYWHRPGFDQIAQLSEPIASELFDTGVNMGPQVASKFLQRALNVLNNGGRDYPDINADGNIGKLTLYVLGQYLNKRRNENGEKVLLRMLNAEQAVRYMDLAEKTPTNERFEFGWIANRVGDN